MYLHGNILLLCHIGVLKVIKFFEYNWQVRDEWLNWCNQLTTEDLLKERLGGVGSILYTFFSYY
ncbi:putative damage-inducible protein DinB [Metabacillus malikii]|uniref:Damage-inducible protein DinB n=1 Tax=Metabacillus malikii TaxID=1504265 RepID=A0ABT9ZL44_9BACI|nr:putative damage-inducible protein DinB [Metabacillus malikii]